MPLISIFIINLFLIILCVYVHYEIFVRLTSFLKQLSVHHRVKVLWAMIFIVIAHVIEIWIFAFAYYFCDKFNALGELTGILEHSLLDYVYYSFVTYTSLGLGDIVPSGNLRFITGIEALIGLVLIAWSASYLYFVMQQYWKKD